MCFMIYHHISNEDDLVIFEGRRKIKDAEVYRLIGKKIFSCKKEDNRSFGLKSVL